MTRVSPTGHRLTRGRARLKEGSEAHLWVAVVRVGVDGVNGGELFCGRRSSGGCGVSAAACKQTGYRARVALRNVTSATDARAGPFGHRGFAGDEPVRRRLR